MQAGSTRTHGGKRRWAIIGGLLLVVLLVAFYFALEFMTFKAKAEGIAIGYQRAAVSAYQMGRPIPDSIFEEGPYRVEVKSVPSSGDQPFTIIVNVRDKYTNFTHFSSQKSVTTFGSPPPR